MTADFTHRANPLDLPELMDQPCTFETLRACLQDLSHSNRLTLAYRPNLTFLAKVTQNLRKTCHPSRSGGPASPQPRSGGPASPQPRSEAPIQPLHLLDLGSGYGDTLRVIARWARRRRLPVTLTGIDLNPNATRAAREATPAPLNITFLTGDALSTPLPHPPDLILSSLVTHHLPDSDLIPLLRWMDTTARLGWFINDLERQPLPSRLFVLLARTLHWHPFLHHDGPVSFRRAFRTPDWQRLLAAAGIPTHGPHAARIRPTFPTRLCVERLHPHLP